jgi:hypothetical protein
MALIKDIDTLKLYTKAAANLQYDDIVPYIASAQAEYAEYYLGATLVLALDTYHNDSDPTPNINYDNLLPYVQAFVTHFAMAKAKADLNINVTSAGFQTQSTNNFVVASKERTDDFYNAQIDLGYAALEKLLNYMVSQSSESDFESWLTTDGYQIATEQFIRTRMHLSQLTNWPINNTGYNTAREALRFAQFNMVQTVLGVDLVEQIKTLLNNGTLFDGNNPEYAATYRKACAVIAYAAMADMATPGDMYKDTYLPRANNYQAILQKYVDDTATASILPEYYNSGLQNLNTNKLGYTNAADSPTLKFVN